MTFPPVARVVYEKNPLEAVICQLRFPPILRIGAEEPARYQERIRDRYPLLRERPTFDIGAALPEILSLPPEVAKLLNTELVQALPLGGQTVYDFLTADEVWTITLARDFLAVTTKMYRRWEEFRGRLEFALDALIAEYSPAFFTRAGLRYRDVIRRSTLGLQGLPWSEVLTPHIAAELSSPDVANAVTQASHQTTINLAGQIGQVRIQHGLGGGKDRDEVPYIIDADFFTEQRTETNDALGRLDNFNREAAWLFRWCITDRVHQALGPRLI